MRNAMIIDEKDNVVVSIESITKGDTVTYLCGGVERSLTALENITIYHKLAVQDIAKNAPICKYGEHIGIALCDIRAGEYVHIHNVAGHREDLQTKA